VIYFKIFFLLKYNIVKIIKFKKYQYFAAANKIMYDFVNYISVEYFENIN